MSQHFTNADADAIGEPATTGVGSSSSTNTVDGSVNIATAINNDSTQNSDIVDFKPLKQVKRTTVVDWKVNAGMLIFGKRGELKRALTEDELKAHERDLASERQRKRRRLVSDDETSFPAVVSNMTETDIFTALINDELVTSSVSLHRRDTNKARTYARCVARNERLKDKAAQLERDMARTGKTALQLKNLRSHLSRKRKQETAIKQRQESIAALFPPAPSFDVKQRRKDEFYAAARHLYKETCAVCAQLTPGNELHKLPWISIPNRNLLECSPDHKKLLYESCKNYFTKTTRHLPNEFLEHYLAPGGVDDNASIPLYRICKTCFTDLTQGNIPKASLKRGKWLGEAPKIFKDATLAELMLVAQHRMVANVVHIWKDASTKLQGQVHIFTHPVGAIASKLPHAIPDLEDCIFVAYAGSDNPQTSSAIQDIVRVRAWIVRAMLLWLKEFNHLYAGVEVDEAILASLPADDCINTLISRVPLDATAPMPDIASAMDITSEHDNRDTFNTTAFLATDGNFANKTEQLAYAKQRVLGRAKTVEQFKPHLPLLLVPKGKYVKPQTRGIFATSYFWLFPYGLGGLDETKRIDNVRHPDDSNPLNFEEHVRWLLLYGDRRFAYDRTFVYATFHVNQQRKAANILKFQLSTKYYLDEMTGIGKLDPRDLECALAHFDQGEWTIHNQNTTVELSENVRYLLKHLRTVSTVVPNYSVDRKSTRKQIRAMLLRHGRAHFFLTVNPADVHSPLVQMLCGTKIDFDDIPGTMPNRKERQTALVRDPVAAASFFGFIFESLIKYLLGYDPDDTSFEGKRRHAEGGILGKIKTYAGTIEEQSRKSLHVHMLIWLEGLDVARIDELSQTSKDLMYNHIAEFVSRLVQESFPGIYYNPVDGSSTAKYFPDATCPLTTAACSSPLSRNLYSTTPLPDDADLSKYIHIARHHQHPNTCIHVDKEAVDIAREMGQLRHQEDNAPEVLHPSCYVPFSSSLVHYDKLRQYDLQMLLSSTQVHQHSFTCFKKGKYCRLGFGRAIVLEKWMLDDDGRILFHRIHPYLNNLTEDLSEALRCNIDNKPLFTMKTADSISLMYYVTDYITKTGWVSNTILKICATTAATTDRYRVDMPLTTSARVLVQACYNKMLAHTEMGAVLAAYIQLGHRLFLTPETFESFRWTQFDAYARRCVPEDVAISVEDNADGGVDVQIETDDRAKKKVVYDNQAEDYIHRPNALEHLSPYTFVQQYHRVKLSRHASKSKADEASNIFRFHVDHPDYRTYGLRKCDKERVPVFNGRPLPTRTADPAGFARACTIIFTSWRTINPPTESWEADWSKHYERLKTMDEAMYRAATTLVEMQQPRKSDTSFLGDCRDSDASDDEEDDDETESTSSDTPDFYKYINDDDIDLDAPTSSSFEEVIPERVRPFLEHVLRSTVSRPSEHYDYDQHYIDAQTAQHALQQQPNVLPLYDPYNLLSDADRIQVDLDRSLDIDVDLLSEQLETTNYDTKIMYDAMIPIARRFHLTGRQLVVYLVVCSRTLNPLLSPVRIFVVGEGGTGKTQLINAIELFHRKVAKEKVVLCRVSATTGAAATLIRGTTVDSLLYLHQYKTKNNPNLKKTLQDTKVLIVDEMSMCGLAKWGLINKQCQEAKNKEEPFGGLSCVFFGDFRQLPPVRQVPIYDVLHDGILDADKILKMSKKRSPGYAQEVYTLLLAGVTALQHVDHFIVLQKQHRVNPAAIQLKTILRQLRTNTGSLDFEATAALLSRHVDSLFADGQSFSNLAYNPDVTIVVPTNNIRSAINERYLDILHETGAPRCISVAKTYIAKPKKTSTSKTQRKTKPTLTTAQQKRILCAANKLPDAPKRPAHNFQLVIGMQLILRCTLKNQQQIGLVNGADCSLYCLPSCAKGKSSLSVEDIEWLGVRFAHLMNEIAIPGLPPGVVLIPARTLQSMFAGHTISRKQFIVSPRKALTIHAVQGKNLLLGMIALLAKSMTRAEIYVALSRVPSLDLLTLFGENLSALLENLPKWPQQLERFISDYILPRHHTFLASDDFTRWLHLLDVEHLNVLEEERVLDESNKY